DVYLVKTDADGNELWSQTYGGNTLDHGWSVRQTSDGGYIITGETDSFGLSSVDVYLIKTDADGNEQWSQTFGGILQDVGKSVQQTGDGGYIITGYTESNSTSSVDICLIKTDASGDAQWSRIYGGSGDDFGRCVQQTTDGEYIIAGYTSSFGIGYYYDVYLIKTDADGDTLWTSTYGGSDDDVGYSVQQTLDGGYIVTGITCSYGAGENDVYLIRLDSEGALPDITIDLTYVSGAPIPASGGDLTYDADVNNNETDPVDLGAWINVTLPNANVITLINRALTLSGGASIARTLTFSVPASAPAGTYTMTGKVGVYPAAVWHSSSFDFDKTAGGDGIFDPGMLQLYGWDDPFETELLENIPAEFVLFSAYPNPFNPTTAISIQLSALSHVNLSVYDISGRKVATLIDGFRNAGSYEVTFDGSKLASGIYFYRLTAGDYTANGKVVLMK
ncbi:MAG: T9SS type A sorting domain-containing protein, partial [bacterium]